MCTTCGCDNEHSHHHHDHNTAPEATITQKLEADILGENKRNAMYNRGWLSAKNIFAINFVSSPGSGKTSLLEATIKQLKDNISISVIEGDQHTSNDADRITAQGVNAIQINTQSGCHLDAHMVTHAIQDLSPETNSMLFIENVGNLVCPAMFDLGENIRVVMVSVTEGDDKPLKYPYMFAESNVCIINKIDLLPYIPADIKVLTTNIRKVNPNITIFELSAYTGEGLQKWCDFLMEHRAINNPHDHHCQDNYFDKMAAKWDSVVQHRKEKIDYILSMLNIKAGDVILDVGTGTGVLIPSLVSKVKEKGIIMAVDSSSKMIEVARKKHKNIANVKFNHADIEVDAIEGLYDHIILYCVYPHLQYPVKTIINLVNNNLKPGGDLMIAHPLSKEAINDVHKSISSLHLPPIDVLVNEYEQSGINVIEFADNEEYYYLHLSKKQKQKG